MWFRSLLATTCRLLLASAALCAGAVAAEAAAAPVEGTWRAPNGAEIRVQPCDTGYCGTLSYIVIPEKQREICKGMSKSDFATLMLDYNNPEKSMQTRSLLGLPLMTAKPTGPASYTASIYNAEDGSTNDVLIWIVNNDTTLRLGGGCLGSICVVTQDWPRVPDRQNGPDFSCGG